MQVFIKEPQMEWLQAQKVTKYEAALDQTDEGAGAAGGAAAARPADWYPRRKINVARWKLEGHNPAKILALELRENRNVRADPKLLEKCVAHLRGELTHPRAQLDRICEPAEQVELLLDLAKDPNILGRTWVGWGSVTQHTHTDTHTHTHTCRQRVAHETQHTVQGRGPRGSRNSSLTGGFSVGDCSVVLLLLLSDPSSEHGSAHPACLCSRVIFLYT
jgi:hypothetical protein